MTKPSDRILGDTYPDREAFKNGQGVLGIIFLRLLDYLDEQAAIPQAETLDLSVMGPWPAMESAFSFEKQKAQFRRFAADLQPTHAAPTSSPGEDGPAEVGCRKHHLIHCTACQDERMHARIREERDTLRARVEALEADLAQSREAHAASERLYDAREEEHRAACERIEKSDKYYVKAHVYGEVAAKWRKRCIDNGWAPHEDRELADEWQADKARIQQLEAELAAMKRCQERDCPHEPEYHHCEEHDAARLVAAKDDALKCHRIVVDGLRDDKRRLELETVELRAKLESVTADLTWEKGWDLLRKAQMGAVVEAARLFMNPLTAGSASQTALIKLEAALSALDQPTSQQEGSTPESPDSSARAIVDGSQVKVRGGNMYSGYCGVVENIDETPVLVRFNGNGNRGGTAYFRMSELEHVSNPTEKEGTSP